MIWKVLEKVKAYAEDLPSTNWNVLAATVASYITLAAYVTSWFVLRPPDEISFGLWLTFLASWLGISYKQFRAKRETFIPGYEERRHHGREDHVPESPRLRPDRGGRVRGRPGGPGWSDELRDHPGGV